MFEKEAEKYLIKLLKRLKIRKEDLAENQPEIQSWEKINFVSLNTSNVSKAYQKGAEFGYNKAKEWHYVKEGCKYPENGESVLVTVLDDNNEKIVTMALFEVENNKRFWDIESRLCSVHSGSEGVCSKIIAWARVLPAGGEK